MKLSKAILVVFSLTTILLAACSPAAPAPTATATATPDELTIDAYGTTYAMETEEAAPATDTPIPTATYTPEPSETPTATPTPTPALPQISVSYETNCRSGQHANFQFLGLLEPGEQVDVVAQSTVRDYWYIVNPDDPDEGYCWLWGQHATVEGETEALPAYTPEATATPQVGFDLWFHGFSSCGSSQSAIFAVHNGGAQRLWSGWITAFEVGSGERLYGPLKDRHPFSDSADKVCPPGHGNELFPGEVDYVFVPLKSMPAETNVYVEFKFCSADHGGGDCVTKIGYLQTP